MLDPVRPLLLLALLATLCSGQDAGGDRQWIEQARNRARLSTPDEPDDWEIADELWAFAQQEVARRFIAASRDFELRTFFANRKVTDHTAWWEVLSAKNARTRMAALRRAARSEDPLLQARAFYRIGLEHLELRRFVRAAAAFARSGAVADDLGWFDGAVRGYRSATRMLLHAGRPEGGTRSN